MIIEAALGPSSSGTHSMAAKRTCCNAALVTPSNRALQQNSVKSARASAEAASAQAATPMARNSRNVRLRPRRAMPRAAGSTPRAVPITIRAMGRVAHCSELARRAPIMLPTSIIMGVPDMATAFTAASSQTILVPVCIGAA